PRGRPSRPGRRTRRGGRNGRRRAWRRRRAASRAACPGHGAPAADPSGPARPRRRDSSREGESCGREGVDTGGVVGRNDEGRAATKLGELAVEERGAVLVERTVG